MEDIGYLSEEGYIRVVFQKETSGTRGREINSGAFDSLGKNNENSNESGNTAK